ncbi:hypothetical protein FisN_10Lh183 [Fistulifera solaris]|uniref:DNA polymerase delta subunit 3 n=1 Tax=Fistulifera solaris TaxID=1519565 RepID=A0A1Z5JTQ6_FISSO|nr:hypothetical protein FisN_10Lh183 [Fistulifera solaris]|eukprot:GAX17319.1 hypothetical protein FisN_10Lh183 [Fistulifera solaris]
MTALYTEDQLQEATSWIEDEGRSVTIATVSQSLGISRSPAQALLEQLGQGTSALRVTVTDAETKIRGSSIPTTVFSLSPSSKDGYMYAISGQESVAMAHERDMDQMRDMLKNNQLSHLTASATDSIAPSEQVLSLMQHNVELSDRPIVSSLDRSKPTAPAKKVTTAESFFQKKSATPAEKTSSSTAEKTTTIKDTKPTLAKSSKGKEFSKENEKENNKKVGRVDDLVGDEDDSEEEDVAPRKKIIRGRQPPKEENVEKEEAPVVEPVVSVRGAMDDFATEMKRPTAPTTTTGRRRRKKLIQKTSMDAQGYLHTETQEVWEDILSDEEDEPIFVPKKPTTQQAANKKVNMKQGSLLGFFTKK